MTAATRLAIALRSLVIQASWNYQTLLGAGFAFALLPALRRAYARDPEGLAVAVGRHAGFFNGHPYFTSIALGAVARLETDGSDPEVIGRLKTALMSPLGTLGDGLIWARWRPLCAFLAVAAFAAGLPWWAAIALFLGLYNTAHFPLRLWGVAFGWRQGLHVGPALARSPLRRLPDRLALPLAAVTGVALPLLVVALLRVDDSLAPAWAAGALVAAAGLRWPGWTGGLSTAALLGSAALFALWTGVAHLLGVAP